MIPVYSFTRVRSTNTKCTRGRGCIGHPAFPTPSLGGRFINGSGASRGEVVNARLDVIASGAKQSISPRERKNGLLRFARNDGKIHVRDLAAHFARVFALNIPPSE